MIPPKNIKWLHKVVAAGFIPCGTAQEMPGHKPSAQIKKRRCNRAEEYTSITEHTDFITNNRRPGQQARFSPAPS